MKNVTRVAVAGLSLTAAGLITLAQFEGYSPQAYIPVAGDVPTIGFGSTAGVRMGDTITVPEALNRLRKDVREAERAVQSCVQVPLMPYEYDSYVSLAFNIGGSAFCGSTLVRKLNAGDYAGACAEIKRWTFSGGRQIEGLVRRRAAEYAQCMGELQQ